MRLRGTDSQNFLSMAAWFWCRCGNELHCEGMNWLDIAGVVRYEVKLVQYCIPFL